jgi:predicted nucleic acid-binding protein
VTRAVVLDAGALVALERADERARGVVATARRRRSPLVIPAGVLAQTWRGSARQVAIARLLQLPEVVVEPLDEVVARAAGVLCGRAGSRDVVDASVVVAALEHRAIVVTSDPDDLRRLADGLVLITV